MIRLLSAVSILVALAFLISCQSYSTGLQKSLDSAGETSAIVTLKTISTAQQTYAASNNGSFASFPQLCEAGYLDSRFNSTNPQVGTYVFSLNLGDKSFGCNADPAPGKATSLRHFYMDSASGEIHANPTEPATSADPALSQSLPDSR
jgi:Tfp pilus assembly protein PilE